MKKQGMPMSLEDMGIDRKRKSDKSQRAPAAKKRRTSDEDSDATKLVKLDRAMRQERAAKAEKKKPKKQQRLVNPDAQVTVPPVLPVVDFEDLGFEDAETINQAEDEAVADDMELQEASLSEDQIEELAQDELEEVSDSVFDTDEEQQQPNAIFSEDEDSDAIEQLNAANIEGLSRKLDEEQAQVDEEAQQELEDDALQTNVAEDGLLDGPDQMNMLAPDLKLVHSRITESVRVLTDFGRLADKSRSRAEYTQQLLNDICVYYGYTPYLAEKLFNLFSPDEAFAFFEANETPRPVVMRTNTLRTNRRTLAQALINRGVQLQPVGKWSKVGLQVYETQVPLGATPEYLAGHYILQAASSFLPVMALAPQEGERILDMAAAPGGKTTYISALMRNTGSVFANDANRSRAKGLIGNIHRLGCKNVIVCNYEAQKAFPKILAGFDRVLLDAPCSGTGVIGKDPSVKTSKNERDFLALPHMQKNLLLSAIDSVDHASKTGGYIVYSTCSVTVEENEQVVQYVLRKRPNVQIADTGLGSFGTPGFTAYQGKKFDDRMNLTRRYFPHRENVDGFFVCKLKKTGPSAKVAASAGQMNGAEGAEHVKTPVVNGKKAAASVNGENEDDMDIAPDDDFGGFDDEADQVYIDKAEKKWLKSRGIDPNSIKGSSQNKDKNEANGKVELDAQAEKKPVMNGAKKAKDESEGTSKVEIREQRGEKPVVNGTKKAKKDKSKRKS